MFNKHMRFDDSPDSSDLQAPKGGRQLCEEWQLIAKFLLQEDTKVFRLACKQINAELYQKLTTFSDQFKKKNTVRVEDAQVQPFKREH